MEMVVVSLYSFHETGFPADISHIQNCVLPVVFCGCETWSLTLREERRLRVFENRVLR
jgi:hypothetical protein